MSQPTTIVDNEKNVNHAQLGEDGCQIQHTIIHCDKPVKSRTTCCRIGVASIGKLDSQPHKNDTVDGSTTTPVSSCTSRNPAALSDSPASRWPPGETHTLGKARMLADLTSAHTRKQLSYINTHTTKWANTYLFMQHTHKTVIATVRGIPSCE